MALTPSNMIPLGTIAPPFSLPDVITNKPVSFPPNSKYSGYLIMFICNHCPYVKHIEKELSEIGNSYAGKGIFSLAISSNDVDSYPEDSPERMKIFAKENNFSFPYLFDADQSVAKRYDAACTPDLYLFDGDLRLFYRGQLDESRPGNGKPVTGKDLRSALDLLLSGQPTPTLQIPSQGCNIKWKKEIL